MKKVISITLLLGVLICSLGGCGGNQTSEANSDEHESITQEAEEQEKHEEPEIITECKFTAENPLVIEIDPGHGGEDSGAVATMNGITVNEKDIDLKIATALKEELSAYDNVKVHMTREADENPGLEERVGKAVSDGAEIIISIHNNAYGDGFPYKDGSMVLASSGNLNEEEAERNQELGAYILRELSGLGLADRGLLLRMREDGLTYENGKTADYYSIVRNSMKSGIGGIIIEHGYMDDEEEFEKYLSDDEKLRELARADARGIKAYFRLEPVTEKATEYKTQTMFMISEDGDDTTYTDVMFRLNNMAE